MSDLERAFRILDGEAPPNGAGPPASARPRFTLDRLSSIPLCRPEYSVDDFAERNSTGAIIGAPGSCKSFLTVGLSAAVGTGRDWFGRRVRQGAVVYIAPEAPVGVRRRFEAEAIANGALDDAAIYLSASAAPLTDPIAAAEAIAAIETVRAEHGSVELIIVDTLSRAFQGDENSAEAMAAFIRHLDWIREASGGACVLVVHHVGHGAQGRARGSSVFHAALDFAWLLEKGDDGIVRASNIKMKDAEPPPPLAFEIRGVELPDPDDPERPWLDDDGRTVTSAVLHEVGFEPAPAPGRAGRGRWQIEAVEILRELVAEHGDRLGGEGFPRGQARVRLEDWRDRMRARDFPRNRVHDLPGSLAEAGKVVLEAGYASPR